jgi:hypothetical protein
MSEDIANVAPSLPGSVLYPTTALLTCLLLWVFWRTKSRIANFMLFAIWMRYMMSAFHTVTYASSPLGMSWNALGSCAIFILGFLLVDTRMLRLRFFLPVYAVMAVIIISGGVNHDVSGTINAIVKYGYFLVLAIGTCEAIELYGEQRFLRVLLWAFVPLIVFQVLSVALGVSKATETDGSVSFIGGYNHEAAFSIALATGFVVAAFAMRVNAVVKVAYLFASLAGLLLANYRTSILAIVPIVFAQFALGTTGMFPKNQRAAVGVVMLTVCLGCVIAGALLFQNRFNDISVMLSSGGNFIKPPDEFTRGDVGLMSGRARIWSEYIYGYLSGSELQRLIGFGADSWVNVFTRYAHNTLISQLYEYGIAGVLALLYLWVSMFGAALRVRRGPRTKLVAAHLSFIVLNFATMPLWMIEGYIFYGVICGYTLYLLKPVRSERARAIPMPMEIWSRPIRPLPVFDTGQIVSQRKT